jgi:cytochrome c553
VKTWLLLLTVALARADDDDTDEEDDREGGHAVAATADPTWTAECGSCHLAYPPGLLPERSWTALLGDLGRHFGDNATVAPATLDRLRAVAAASAADRSTAGLSRWITRVTAGTTPLRISTVPALRAEHLEEVPASRVGPGEAVTSWASCASCHAGAASGRF